MSTSEPENDFWNVKWEKNETGFHLSMVHPLLVRYLPECNIKQPACVFVPLCGKTLDISFFLEEGADVVAIELNESAVVQLFESLNISPIISDWTLDRQVVGSVYAGSISHGEYTKELTVFVGDFFNLRSSDLDRVTFIYDRASLVAFPENRRYQYAQHIQRIAPDVGQLLITLDYDLRQMQGPPYPVSDDEVRRHYRIQSVDCVRDKDIIEHEPRFAAKGLTYFFERVYIIN